MGDPISANYFWNPDELVEALATHNRLSLRPFFRFLLGLLLLGYLLISIVFPLFTIASPRTSPEAKVNATMALALALFIWVGGYTTYRRKSFLKWKARRAFRSLPGGVSWVEWTFEPDEISCRTSLAASTLLWKAFLKVVETPKGFMLYLQPAFFNWIPARAFVSEAEMRRFAAMGREKAANYVLNGECQFARKPEPLGPEEI